MNSIETKESLSYRLRINQLLWRVRLVLYSYLNYKDSSRGSKPIFVISFSRTGSSLLMQKLAQCSEVSDCGEILNQRIIKGLGHRRRGVHDIVSFINLSLNYKNTKFSVIKLHFNHLEKRGVNISDIADNFPKEIFIFLYRKALLEQYCSMKLASSTRKFSGAIRNHQDKIHLDIDDWQAFRDKVTANYRNVIQYFHHKDKADQFILLSYEDLVSGKTQNLLERMKSYSLSFNHIIDAKSNLLKQERRQIQQIISNYEMVAKQLGPAQIDLESDSLL